MTGRLASSKKLLTRLGAVAAAGAILMTSACAQPAATPASNSEGGSKPATLTIAVPFGAGAPGGIPLWIGDKLGYFQDENLTVKFVNFPGKPAEAVGLVVAKQADLTITAPDTIIVPTAKGENQGLTWIFTPYQRPSFAIGVPEDSSIKSAKDLEGKNVGMASQGPPFETFMDANIKADGGSADSTKVTVLPGAPAFEALRKGDIGAYVANRAELALTAQLTDTKMRVLDMPASVENGLAGGFMMRADSTADQKDAYARFLRAFLKAGMFSQENPDAAVKLNWAMYPASKPSTQSDEEAMTTAKVVLKTTVDEYRSTADGQWGYIAPDRWTAYIEGMGLGAKIPDPSVLYDNSLLKQISNFDQAAVREAARKYTS
jgi:ABC-type nitrate/sulfonate/bicarbonate transport system substrate-binding protein